MSLFPKKVDYPFKHYTQMVSTVTRSQSNRCQSMPLGCGGMGDFTSWMCSW